LTLEKRLQALLLFAMIVNTDHNFTMNVAPAAATSWASRYRGKTL